MIHRFEELECWKKARELENEVFLCTLENNFSRDFGLKDQINRSTGSVMDNIAEGFGRGGNKEFVNFLLIAKSSAHEVQSQLYRSLDRKYINEAVFSKMYALTDYIISLIVKLVQYLKKSELTGIRYKKND
ncbi:MAG: four helix bundle protein [Verrucomicrobia bacterium]|nr:four helix bundle protein [Cytophagales bacterium]